MRYVFTILLILSCGVFFSCAQRVSISKTYGQAYQQIFYQQGSAPPVQLAPTTSEDAKRISASRSRRSGTTRKSSRSSNVFSLGGSGSSGSNLQ